MWITPTAITPQNSHGASAEANVKRLEDLESFKRVYAPFSGVITQRNVDIGTLINAGNGGISTKEMFDLAQIDPLRVYVSVPQSYAPSIHAGLKACLSLREFRQRNFCGQVVRTANAIDPSTRTLLTEVDVPNPSGPSCPGHTRKCTLTPSSPASGSPSDQCSALPPGRNHGGGRRTGQPIILKKITIGRDFGTAVEVLEGIEAADRVVINPPDAQEQTNW